MRAADIESAAAQTGTDAGALCVAFQTVLPVLEVLAQKQSWLVRLFLGGFMGAIRVYVAEKCG